MSERDFTLRTYHRVVEAFSKRYPVMTLAEFAAHPDSRAVCFRHDIDRRVTNALDCANVLDQLGVRGVFYFRYPYTFDENIITQVAELGHEIGYHYETVSKSGGDLEKAVRLFKEELAAFRALAPVTTACMHGAPLSPHDNRAIWHQTTLEAVGLSAEPYMSFASADLCYITDTGRAWNHPAFSLRDRLGSDQPRFRSSNDLIAAVEQDSLPDRVMMTFHPERWTDAFMAWLSDLVLQNTKNVFKRALRSLRS